MSTDKKEKINEKGSVEIDQNNQKGIKSTNEKKLGKKEAKKYIQKE